jgi:hypothetical protein
MDPSVARHFFLWGCLKPVVCHNGKLETRQMLLQAIKEAAVGTRNELEHVQQGQSAEQHVTA